MYEKGKWVKGIRNKGIDASKFNCIFYEEVLQKPTATRTNE
jgi:hypothetical protein